MSEQRDSIAAFRHPGVARFAVGRFLSAMAATSISVAVGWRLYEQTDSMLALGIVGLVEVIPVLGLALPAGIASDRFPRRRVAIASHLTLALCAGALGLLSWFSGPTWAYYVALFFLGVGTAFRGPSVGAMLPQLVPPKDFTNANAWISSTYELASISGPAVAGFLIAAVSDAWLALLFAFCSHLGFTLVLFTLPEKPAANARLDLGRAGKHGLTEMLAGLRFVRDTKVFLAAITLDLFAVLFGGCIALMPVYAKDVLHVGPVGLGWLRAAPALGALSMALLQTRLPAWKRPGIVLLVTVAGFGIANITFGLSKWMWLSLLSLFLAGVFDNVSVVIRATLEQSLTPDAMRGRVSAIHYVFVGMSNELGSFESGATAAMFGPIASVVGGGIGTLLVVVFVALYFPQLRTLPPLHQLQPAQTMQPAE
ncbi:MAG: MFS transporter [Archangium sp.]|nr:MFS transporter [Archangium sp.]